MVIWFQRLRQGRDHEGVQEAGAEVASGQVHQARGEEGGGADVHEDRRGLRGAQGRGESQGL